MKSNPVKIAKNLRIRGTIRDWNTKEISALKPGDIIAFEKQSSSGGGWFQLFRPGGGCYRYENFLGHDKIDCDYWIFLNFVSIISAVTGLTAKQTNAFQHWAYDAFEFIKK